MARSLASPAMVVAMLAFIIAVGGTSYAVTKLPKNSVGTEQLKNRAVTTPKLAPDASARIAGLTYRRYTFTANPHMGAVVTVTCPTGLTTIAGGIESPHTLNTFLLDGHPGPRGWEASVGNSSDFPEPVNAYAVCAKVEGGAAKMATLGNATGKVRTFELPEAR